MIGAPKVLMKRYGGKVYLAKQIISHFPEHKIYVEPFCGSCAVLFAKPKSQDEVINDLDSHLINAFKVARENPYELAALLWATPYSSANWREAPRGDLETAALHIAKTQQFYAGATGTSTFSIDAGHANKSKPKVWADWFKRVLPAFLRLKDVQILNEDGLKTIERFSENPDALIYVDPPYVGHEAEYHKKVDYRQMAEILRSAKAKVVVSGLSNCALFFPGWHQVEIEHCVRALTGRHKQKAKTTTERLFIKPEKHLEPKESKGE